MSHGSNLWLRKGPHCFTKWDTCWKSLTSLLKWIPDFYKDIIRIIKIIKAVWDILINELANFFSDFLKVTIIFIFIFTLRRYEK